MDKSQRNFEDSVILESELPMYYNSYEFNLYTVTLDEYPYELLTLSQIASDYGRDLDFRDRQMLKILINERFNRLNETQRKIAELKYIEEKTVREISASVNKSISTVQYHINKINEILRSI